MAARAFIAGCSGLVLSVEERAFFRQTEPWGFILFRRNIATPEQVSALCAELRISVGRDDAPILIDQEGGRVQRLGPPHWPAYPAGRRYGDLYAHDPILGSELCRLGARLIAADLSNLGITVDCLPVLDVPVEGAHDVIGNRAYATDRKAVAELGRAAAEGLLAGGVLPVMKHIPGHGRGGVDSHLGLPVVDAPIEALVAEDFAPFRSLADLPAAMSAHIVYSAIDPDHPATTSKRVIETIIRGHIGFDGLLMSDDLSMKALGGSFEARTEAAFAAGIDIALHCNGDLAEMRAVAAATPALDGKPAERANAALLAIARAPEPFDTEEARAKLDAALLDGVAV